MLQFFLYSEGGARLLAAMQQYRNWDLRPLADRLAEVLIDENRKARLAGIDKDGLPLHEVCEETIKRRMRAGKGMGPPLVPDSGMSRVSADASVDVEYREHGATLYLHWPTAEPWLGTHRWTVNTRNGKPWFHRSWPEGRPVRDIVGINPAMRQAIEDTVREFVVEGTKIGVASEPDAGIFEGGL